jgi:N-methylhydantoinase A
VSWKARLTVHIAIPATKSSNDLNPDVARASGTRPCYFGKGGYNDTPIFKPGDLAAGQTVEGPAIVEEATTTLVINPGMTVTVSGAGNYLLTSAA